MAEEGTRINQAQQRPGESIFLAVLLAALLSLFPETLKLPGIIQGVWAGPGSVAQALLLSMAVLTAGLLVVALRTSGVVFMPAVRYLFSRDAVLLLATVIVYAVVLVPLGFELATFSFLTVSMYLLDPTKLVRKGFLAVCTVGVVVIIFAWLFEVVLP